MANGIISSGITVKGKDRRLYTAETVSQPLLCLHHE